jgi:ABC-type uncharacterized transport system substrate-binding protein
MFATLRRLALGFALIAAAAAVLLLSDQNRRTTTAAVRIPAIAILQHASSPVLDDTVRGMRDGLAERGFREGETITIRAFNAEGDVATSNTMATAIVSGGYDLVLTSSTPSMQAIANMNKTGAVKHVFGAVADPYSSGIGLDRDNPAAHPPHLVGLGTLLPVDDSFRLAKRLLPSLKTIGIAWNPAESNSQTFTRMARVAAPALGLEIVEANVDNTSAVGEAVSSLIGRGAQAIWIGGDNTMMSATGTVVATARRGGVPVFTITPGPPTRGTLFDIGVDFHAVGLMTGRLAADVLEGANPATIPIRDVLDDVPRRLIVNTTVTRALKERWTFPGDVLAGADVVVDDAGVHEKAKPAAATPSSANPATARPTKRWRVAAIAYVDSPTTEEAIAGVMSGLKAAGLTPGQDIDISVRNAQGDMATLNSMIDASLGEGVDAFVTFSTPTLQAALRKASRVPVVFTLVANAVLAGAGKSNEDHLPNVSGIVTESDYAGLAKVLREAMPRARRCGTLFTPAEVNSVYNKDRWVEAARAVGLEVVQVAATTAGDVADAALAMAAQRLDAICQISDNLTMSSFASILNAARQNKLPVFAFQTPQARDGAVIAVARDYTDAGQDAAAVLARVVRGESLARIPIKPPERSRLVVNLKAAAALGLTIPPAIVSRADEVIR